MQGMKQGFTLLELSIVLVIIGLIIGGITVGADMIRSAELNTIVTDLNKYQTTVNTFKLKYNALPGDMKNATAYWGNADTGATGGECADPLDDAGTGTQTCNGDGNGKIVGTAANYTESFRFWQHLTNAELVSGSFTGVSATNNDPDGQTAGENSPEGRISGSGWSAWDSGTLASSTGYYSETYNGVLFFGGSGNGAALNYQKLLPPEEAYIIDTKLDDGVPGKGGVMALYWDDCTDAANNTDYTSEYLLSDNTQQCALIFRNLW